MRRLLLRYERLVKPGMSGRRHREGEGEAPKVHMVAR